MAKPTTFENKIYNKRSSVNICEKIAIQKTKKIKKYGTYK